MIVKEKRYVLSSVRFGRSVCFAVVSDLHGSDPSAVLRSLEQNHPDFILMPGDIFERLDGANDEVHENALTLLREAAKIAPVIYSTGNHEDGSTRSWCPKRFRNKPSVRHHDAGDLRRIEESGAILLDDSFVCVDGILFGGLSSGLWTESEVPNVAWLNELCAENAPKVLLCHHPEYYKKYLKKRSLDLIVSGHAHGGQWRLFGRGVFAPGQGIFPKYTSGVHDDRFVISTGLKPSGKIPRIFNQPQVVYIYAK